MIYKIIKANTKLLGVFMRLIIVTIPIDKATLLAKTIVEEGLVACANIIPTVRSIYTWKGKIEDDEESMMFIKTRTELLEKLTLRIKELHPYEVPEIISMEIKDNEGNKDYLKWIIDNTKTI